MAQGGNVGGRVAGGFDHGGHLWLLVRQHGALHHSGSAGGRSCRCSGTCTPPVLGCAQWQLTNGRIRKVAI